MTAWLAIIVFELGMIIGVLVYIGSRRQ